MKYNRMEGIRPRREALGLSIQEAAARLQVTRQAWYVWETADVMPASGLLPDLAAVLGCRIEELYEAPSDAARQLPQRGSQ